MALNDVFKIEIIAAGPDGEELAHVLHYYDSSGGGAVTPAFMTLIAGTMDTVFANAYLAIASAPVVYNKTVATCIGGSGVGFQATDIGSNGFTGGSAGNTGTIERALLISKRTFVAGRQFRGRNFWAMPCVESYLPDGAYDSSVANPDAAAQASLATAIVNPVNVATFAVLTPCIYHRAAGNFTAVVNAFVSPTVGVQRRRRIGVGA